MTSARFAFVATGIIANYRHTKEIEPPQTESSFQFQRVINNLTFLSSTAILPPSDSVHQFHSGGRESKRSCEAPQALGEQVKLHVELADEMRQERTSIIFFYKIFHKDKVSRLLKSDEETRTNDTLQFTFHIRSQIVLVPGFSRKKRGLP